MDNAINNYIHMHIVSEPLLMLMHFKGAGTTYLKKIDNDESIELISSYDYIRNELKDNIKDKFAKEIYKNHGVSLKYIRQIFMPVGIDIPTNPSYLSSLQNLANERGAYAHKFRDKGTVRKSVSPEYAKICVDDCKMMCKEILEKAKLKGDLKIKEPLNLTITQKLVNLSIGKIINSLLSCKIKTKKL